MERIIYSAEAGWCRAIVQSWSPCAWDIGINVHHSFVERNLMLRLTGVPSAVSWEVTEGKLCPVGEWHLGCKSFGTTPEGLKRRILCLYPYWSLQHDTGQGEEIKVLSSEQGFQYETFQFQLWFCGRTIVSLSLNYFTFSLSLFLSQFSFFFSDVSLC